MYVGRSAMARFRVASPCSRHKFKNQTEWKQLSSSYGFSHPGIETDVIAYPVATTQCSDLSGRPLSARCVSGTTARKGETAAKRENRKLLHGVLAFWHDTHDLLSLIPTRTLRSPICAQQKPNGRSTQRQGREQPKRRRKEFQHNNHKSIAS